MLQERTKKKIPIPGIDELKLFGPRDKFLRMLEASLDAKIVPRNGELTIDVAENKAGVLEKVLYEMIMMVTRDQVISDKDVNTLLDVTTGKDSVMSGVASDESADSVILYKKDGYIQPKSQGQLDFYASCRENDIVFAIGPAGTGKTYLAVAFALAQLREKTVSRIILSRPAIEAGENLGFLPGDLMEKVDPYLRPLTDALFDMLSPEQLQKYVDRKIIEIVPLGYMRGRTLNDAFVILDEAQNASALQMKMFLTRLGNRSRAIITGDVTQIDLPERIQSGLVQIQNVLKGIEGIQFVYFDKMDVVRHRLVREIINAYEKYDDSLDEE